MADFRQQFGILPSITGCGNGGIPSSESLQLISGLSSRGLYRTFKTQAMLVFSAIWLGVIAVPAFLRRWLKVEVRTSRSRAGVVVRFG